MLAAVLALVPFTALQRERGSFKAAVSATVARWGKFNAGGTILQDGR
ncbi:MAG: hypothetical protein J2P50_08620 [Hyphomicrobiaceae bacterium]|nr:hypothetical protein [Hyphomicrobiaceae bacterium]